ncbi:hypothetical protein PFMALIP_05681 [Plasmodium falciparum MaliPS096_E11]|uniref:Surface antigen n=1 Tax=Plasmodium falciparum MaliPS096_E11 TaxID=1036727 RepID=A0A024WHV5_PLAFA|nr:hypothetical protein PFMALIP_05681 [Plasmodium falciparum MaliPS096_E11]
MKIYYYNILVFYLPLNILLTLYHLVALYRDIFTEDIPTCICEKSLSDKVEKTCLKCGGILGGGLEPTVGLLVTVVVNQLAKATTVASIEFATQEGIKSDIGLTLINSKNYNTVTGLATSSKTAKEAVGTTCLRNTPLLKAACYAIFNKSKVLFGPIK